MGGWLLMRERREEEEKGNNTGSSTTQTTRQWSGRERETRSRASCVRLSLLWKERKVAMQERETNEKEKKVWGILSGGVGTLKFLCEIFSITLYLSLAVSRPFPLALLLPACLVAPRLLLPLQLARTTASLHTTDELLLLLLLLLPILQLR